MSGRTILTRVTSGNHFMRRKDSGAWPRRCWGWESKRLGAFKVPIKVKVTLFDGDLSIFEPMNRVITWDAVDLFKYTRTG